MADELDDILTPGTGDIGREQLLKYLNGELSGEEQHRIEKAMLDSGMLNDAVEGLQNLPDKKKIQLIQKNIDSDLRKYLSRKKNRKSNREIKGFYWIIITILVILIIVVVTFAVIYVDRKIK